ncbi:hypothetical protein [Photobacterium leiognathi]|uniref:hypothetical protein n=1 Tax=Photobacterium leiognathi TaxID=553611 RepID=UPI0027383988|nr:hypothetical protein [Photobacterium leiognathi]
MHLIATCTIRWRTSPGSNIFIHGKQFHWVFGHTSGSIEELFLLAERTGLDNIEVVISPRDPKKGS